MIRMPSPRAHLRGTRRAWAVLAGSEGPAGVVGRWLDRPEALPAAVPPAENTLKYDLYLADGPAGPAHGLAVADRWEEGNFPVSALLSALGGGYALDAAAALRARLSAGAMQTLALGFDRPGAPPRAKLYLQEAVWGAGLGPPGAVEDALRAVLPGLPAAPPLPGPVGVVTVEAPAGAAPRAKLYVGGADPRALAVGLGAETAALAAGIAAACTHPGGHWYLTVRLGAGQPVRTALNHIYNHVQDGFRDRGAGLAAAWDDVERQVAGTALAPRLAALRRTLDGEGGLRLVPTATAWEPGGGRDVYFGAWALDGDGADGRAP